eukprot:3324162-Lingulodinium_polyedra.AAC.1
MARRAEGSGPIHYRHVKPHTGHPWNALADTLADRAHAEVGKQSAPLPMAGWGTEEFEATEHFLTLH